jgi:hypothetical protein
VGVQLFVGAVRDPNAPQTDRGSQFVDFHDTTPEKAPCGDPGGDPD